MRLDFETPLVVNVTAEDIAAGRRGCNTSCPIALALSRHGLTMWGSKWITPADDAENFVRAFDAGRPVKPFTFTIVAIEAEETS